VWCIPNDDSHIVSANAHEIGISSHRRRQFVIILANIHFPFEIVGVVYSKWMTILRTSDWKRKDNWKTAAEERRDKPTVLTSDERLEIWVA